MNRYLFKVIVGLGVMVLFAIIVEAYKFNQTEFYIGNNDVSVNMQEQHEIPQTGDTHRVSNPDVSGGNPTGKLKADVFTGKLGKVDTGCFADGECYVEVDGKHVTALMGWSRDMVGSVQGVQGFGDLEKYIGKTVEVYAQVKPDGTYTLYGSGGFYIKPVEKEDTTMIPLTSGAGCVVGGCSSQLCVDAKDGPAISTCEYTEVYACYQTATCERQTDGQCGWTETPELLQCISSKKTNQLERI